MRMPIDVAPQRRVVEPRGQVARAPKAKPVSPREVASRVDTIVGLMQRDEWRQGVTGPELAKVWNVTVQTAENYATEASRRVVYLARIVENPDELKTDVTKVLMRSLHAAHDERARGDVARIGDIVTKIVGAQAPNKIDLTLRQYEGMTPEAMKAKLLEQRAKIDEALAKLESDAPKFLNHPFFATPEEPEGQDPGPDAVVEHLPLRNPKPMGAFNPPPSVWQPRDAELCSECGWTWRTGHKPDCAALRRSEEA